MSTDDKKSELTTSQINQSEAGPDIVEVEDLLLKNTELLDEVELIKTTRTDQSSGRGSILKKFDPLVNTSDLHTPEKNGSEDHEKLQQNPTNQAIQVLDKLISLSPSSKQPINVVSPLKNDHSDHSKKNEKDSSFKLEALEQSVLEIELAKLHDLLVKQEKVSQDKMAEYEARFAKLTGQNIVLQDQLKEAEEREKALVKKVNEQNQNQLQLSIVMQEYEKLISKLTTELETEKKHNREKTEALTVEKDSALVHLSNVEAAFTDVHQKYEKCKKVIEDYKKNEAKMKSLINDQLESLRVKEKQLETIQIHASKQLENAHIEVERSKQIHEQEMTRLRALLRKTELKVISLQESLEQKIKENQELTTICDDLIEGKVPTH